MKAITLYQPWATLMAIGAKTFETRSWDTKYRGLIAIHSAKAFPIWAQELMYQEPFFSMLERMGYDDPESLQRGVILSIHDLKETYPTPNVPGQRKLYSNSILIPPAWPESQFGNYGARRYAWHMPLSQMLDVPYAIRGHQRLWEWDGDANS